MLLCPAVPIGDTTDAAEKIIKLKKKKPRVFGVYRARGGEKSFLSDTAVGGGGVVVLSLRGTIQRPSVVGAPRCDLRRGGSAADK